MRTRSRPAVLLAALAAFTGLAAAPAPRVQARATLVPVASFERQVTGVTAARDGRVFVNFPRWTEDTPVSVAEVTDASSPTAGTSGCSTRPPRRWSA